MKDSIKKYLAVFAVLAVLLLVAIAVRSMSPQKSEEKGVEIVGKNMQIKVDKSGNMNYFSGSRQKNTNIGSQQFIVLQEYLKNHSSSIKPNSQSRFYTIYYYENGQLKIVYLDANDPLIKNIIDVIEGEGNGEPNGDGSGNDNGDGGGIDFDFTTPTPTPTSPPGSTLTPTPTTPAFTPPPDCPLWLLSYCVYPRTPRPTPTPTSQPQPTPVVEAGCENWLEEFEGDVIISNTYCVKE